MNEKEQKFCKSCKGFTDSGEIPKSEIARDNWCYCRSNIKGQGKKMNEKEITEIMLKDNEEKAKQCEKCENENLHTLGMAGYICLNCRYQSFDKIFLNEDEFEMMNLKVAN